MANFPGRFQLRSTQSAQQSKALRAARKMRIYSASTTPGDRNHTRRSAARLVEHISTKQVAARKWTRQRKLAVEKEHATPTAEKMTGRRRRFHCSACSGTPTASTCCSWWSVRSGRWATACRSPSSRSSLETSSTPSARARPAPSSVLSPRCATAYGDHLT